MNGGQVFSMKLFFTLSILFSSISLYAGDMFAPWGTDLNVGDRKGSISSFIRAKRDRVSPVTNGLQGGGYFLIRFFQVAISPQDGPNCRFKPTCSAYGRQAVERYGAFMGAVLAGERLIRCNPYNPPGHDPLPLTLTGD